jgi:hypothetical protein
MAGQAGTGSFWTLQADHLADIQDEARRVVDDALGGASSPTPGSPDLPGPAIARHD